MTCPYPHLEFTRKRYDEYLPVEIIKSVQIESRTKEPFKITAVKIDVDIYTGLFSLYPEKKV